MSNLRVFAASSNAPPRETALTRACSVRGLPAPLHDHALLPWRFAARLGAADTLPGRG